VSPRCVLVGPPGAGKSTVGRLLAVRLGVPFRDTDEDVVAVAGKSIAEVFFDDGEAAFRELEAAAVARALAEHDGVLSLGGGAVLDAGTRALLADHLVVFLSVGLADAATRVGFSSSRPVLALNPRATLAALMAERLPLYQEVATLELPTDGRSAQQVAEELAGRLVGQDRSS
jgi:shikimate kinase